MSNIHIGNINKCFQNKQVLTKRRITKDFFIQIPFVCAGVQRDEEEERRKRRREKNKVAAARCRNKKKERTDYLQKVTRGTKAQTLCYVHPSWPSPSLLPPQESERLEMLNSDLKAQIEELKLERQQLILLLNRHRPTCIVRTDSVQTPDSEGNPLLEQLEAK